MLTLTSVTSSSCFFSLRNVFDLVLNNQKVICIAQGFTRKRIIFDKLLTREQIEDYHNNLLFATVKKNETGFDGFDVEFNTTLLLSLLNDDSNQRGKGVIIVTVLVTNITYNELFEVSKNFLIAFGNEYNKVAIYNLSDMAEADIPMFQISMFPHQEPYKVALTDEEFKLLRTKP